MNEAALQYANRGRKYLAQASEELARDDLEQASEKGWGAASQLLKAVAEERGWKHGQHRNLYTVARRLAQESEDEDLRTYFAYAGELHTNFYEGLMDQEDVEYHLERVTSLVDRVEAMLNNGA